MRATERRTTLQLTPKNTARKTLENNKQTADAAWLKARGIIVRAVRGYGLPHCLRITIGTAEEVGLIAEAMDAFMATQDWKTHA